MTFPSILLNVHIHGVMQAAVLFWYFLFDRRCIYYVLSQTNLCESPRFN